jgi:hypothetical protein
VSSLPTLIDYPLNLPSQGRDVSVTRGDGRIITKTEQGPKKIRRQFTSVPDTFQCSLVLDAQQILDFNTFWDTTLAGGVLTFNWEDPQTDATREMQFISRSDARLLRAGVTGERSWRITIDVEML